MDQSRNYSTRAFLGGLLVIIGALFLLRSMDIIPFDFPHVFISWAFVMFVVGIIILVNSRKKFLGILFIVIGGVNLLPRLFPQIDIDGGVIVSILIIGLGLHIIFRHRRRNIPVDEYTTHTNPFEREKKETINLDYIDEVAIFGGGQRIVHTNSFKGGSITAIFGGCEINLSDCKLAEGTNVIDILAIFGGTEINVPRNWNVIINAVPIFGGFSNKIIRDPNLPVDMSRTLIIKGLAMFGGFEINSKYS